jgi:preprotein translocase subunit SecG
MQSVLIVIHLMVIVTMIGFVLLQRSEGGGLGIGSTGGFLSSRGTANVLTRATAFLALAFFATSLVLSLLAGMERKPKSILQGSTPASQQAPGTPTAPTAPTAPLAPSGSGLLDTLRGGGGEQPSGPQVPQSR